MHLEQRENTPPPVRRDMTGHRVMDGDSSKAFKILHFLLFVKLFISLKFYVFDILYDSFTFNQLGQCCYEIVCY